MSKIGRLPSMLLEVQSGQVNDDGSVSSHCFSRSYSDLSESLPLVSMVESVVVRFFLNPKDWRNRQRFTRISRTTNLKSQVGKEMSLVRERQLAEYSDGSPTKLALKFKLEHKKYIKYIRKNISSLACCF